MRRRFRFNSNSQIVDGIEEALYEAITIAYKNNNGEILYDIIDTFRQIINKSIETLSSAIFETHLPYISRLYYLALPGGEYSISLKRYVPVALKEIINEIIRDVRREGLDITKKEILIQRFLKYSLTEFNVLLHSLLINKHKEEYQSTAHQFYQYIYHSVHRNDYDMRTGKSKLEKDELIVDRYIDSLAFYQYSWILFLYQHKKLELTEGHDFLVPQKIVVQTFEDFLDTLLFIRSRNYRDDDLGTYNWEEDIIQRREGTAYTPLSTEYWTTQGMLIYLIKAAHLTRPEIDTQYIQSINSSFSYHFRNILEVLEDIRNSKDLWLPIIYSGYLTMDEESKGKNEMDFQERINKINKALNTIALVLRKEVLLRENKETQGQEVLTEKINAYKNQLGEGWYNKSLVHQLFDKLGGTIISTDTTIEELRLLRQVVTKRAFFKTRESDDHQDATEYGSSIAQSEDNRISEAIIKHAFSIDFSQISNNLSVLIELVRKNNFKPSAIIIGSNWIYSAEPGLMTDKDYVHINNLPETKKEYRKIGSYQNIPVYESYSILFEDYAIVADFEKAFELIQVQNETWYRKQLKIELGPISNEEALDIIQKSPDLKQPNGIPLSEAEAIENLQTNLLLLAVIREKFEVKNNQALALGRLKPEEI